MRSSSSNYSQKGRDRKVTKLILIFLLATSIALLVGSRGFRSKALFSKCVTNIIAVLVLGSTKNLDDGSMQTLAFLLVPTGILVCFLWTALYESEVES